MTRGPQKYTRRPQLKWGRREHRSSDISAPSPARMFSGFDFKRFSLDALQENEEASRDALQDEQNEEATPTPMLPVVTEHAEHPEHVGTPPPQKLPPADEENSEWDWDQDNTAAQVERSRGVSEQRRDKAQSQQRANSLHDDSRGAFPTAGMSVGAASPAESEQTAGHRGREGGADNLVEERRDVARVFQEANNAAVVGVVVEEGFSNKMVRVTALKNLPEFLAPSTACRSMGRLSAVYSLL